MSASSGLALILLTAASAAAPLTRPDTTTSVRASGYVDVLGVVPTEDSQRQRPQGIAVLRLDADIAAWLEGRIELRGRAGGPFEGGHPGMFNFVHTFQNYSPTLEVREAYATARFEKIDLRIGIQQFSWGKLDGIPPTDVLNPRDLHDPFVTDFEEAKIGIPSVQALYHLTDLPSFSLGQMRASLVYVPIAVPSRLPLLEERWFPPGALPHGRIVRTKFQVDRSLDEELFRLCHRPEFKDSKNPGCIHGVNVKDDLTIEPVLRTGNDRAAYALDSGGVGLRLQGTWRDTDWDLYHYTGPETGPETSTVAGLLTTDTDLPIDTGATIPIEFGRVRAPAALVQRSSLIHMTGFDWATALGDATARGEFAFFNNRPYLRIAQDLLSPTALNRVPFPGRIARRILENLEDGAKDRNCTPRDPCRASIQLGELFPRRDSIEWGVGIDYMIHGIFLLAQMNQIVLLESAPRLIIANPETRFTTVVRRRFLQDSLELELRGAYTVDRGGWFVFPRVTYMIADGLRLRLGYLALGGSRNSLIGQFGRNDELTCELRYGF